MPRAGIMRVRIYIGLLTLSGAIYIYIPQVYEVLMSFFCTHAQTVPLHTRLPPPL